MTMISHILPMGNVVTTINRVPGGGMGEIQVTLERDFMLQITDGQPAPGRRPPLLIPAEMPVIVLIDEGSASASEMLSGSLQVNHRAVIMGKPSHGKGVGQTVIPLSWGRQINVTSFEFRPGDKAMDWVGVIPDIEVDMPEGAKTDVQLDAATAKAKELIATAEARAKRAEELEKLHRENFDKELQSRNQKRSERLSQQP
jgi:C-terminal processing protease CtpA/Prc